MVFASHVERMAGAAASEEALQLVRSNMRACIVNCENLNEDVIVQSCSLPEIVASCDFPSVH